MIPKNFILYDILNPDTNINHIYPHTHLSNNSLKQKKSQTSKQLKFQFIQLNLYQQLFKKNTHINHQILKYQKQWKKNYGDQELPKIKNQFLKKNCTQQQKLKLKTQFDQKLRIRKKNQIILTAIDFQTENVTNINHIIQNNQAKNDYSKLKKTEGKSKYVRKLQSINQFAQKNNPKNRLQNYLKNNYQSNLTTQIYKINPNLSNQTTCLKIPLLQIKKYTKSKIQDIQPELSTDQQLLLCKYEQKQNNIPDTCPKLLEQTDFFVQLSKQSKMLIKQPGNNLFYKNSKQKLLAQLMELQRIHSFALKQDRKFSDRKRFLFQDKKQLFS